MTRRRWYLSLAVALAIMLQPPSAVPTALAQARSPGIQALVLQSQTPWVGAGGTFEIRIASPPELSVAPDDLEYAISIHPASPTRNAFSSTMTARPRTASLAVVITAVTQAPTDNIGSVTLAVGVADPAQPPDRTRVGLRGAGVYPVAVELRTVGGAVHARLLTHLLFVPTPPTGPRLAVGVVVPIRAPIVLQPNGEDDLAQRDIAAITGVARTLATLPAPGVLLAPSPETLAALLRGRRADTQLAVELVRALAASHTILPSPFVPTESAASREGERVASRDRGTAVMSATFGAVVLSDVTVVDSAGDDRLVGELPARLVVPDSVLQPAALRFTTAEPILVRRANSRSTTPALLGDGGLAAHLSNRASPVLAAHHLLADLATIYFDSPGRFRSIVVVPPPGWRGNAQVLAPLIAGLASSPILEAAAPNRLFAMATRRTVPRTRVLLSPLASESLPGDFTSLRDTMDSLRTVMSDAPPARQNLDDRLLIAASTRLGRSQRRDYVAGLAAALTDERRKFQLPKGGSLTLTARRGAIPITVRSTAAYPARVLLEVASDRLKFPGGTTRVIRLDRQDTTERFNVASLGSGNFPLRILLKSPDGKVLLSQTRLTVRSTNASGVGVGLSVGAGLFLLGWWYRHSLRRRRSLATAPPAADE